MQTAQGELGGWDRWEHRAGELRELDRRLASRARVSNAKLDALLPSDGR
jgi:hypothetical protein